MNLQLSHKRALITGATSGLGARIALTLALEGAKVAIGGRDRARAESVVRAIQQSGGSAFCALGDLRDDEGADQCFGAARDQLGSIDILVNAVGRSPPVLGEGTVPNYSDWSEVYAELVLTTVRMIHRVTPLMRQSGWGRVVQIASADALTPGTVPQAYASAKAALVNMTLGLSKALAGTGITVNCVSPGLLQTEANVDADPAELVQRHGRQSVPGLGDMEGVASLVALVASPITNFATGANIRVDGGFSPAVN